MYSVEYLSEVWDQGQTCFYILTHNLAYVTPGWLVGWLLFTSHRQRGHILETAPPFTVHCQGRAARFLHRSNRESNVAVHYTTAAPRQVLVTQDANTR